MFPGSRIARRAIPHAHGAESHGGGALLGLCAIALLWAGVFHSLAVEREQALRDAGQNTANLARAFEEYILRTIKTVDQTLLLARQEHRSNPAGFDIAAWTRSTMALTDLDSQISLVDRHGMLESSNFLAPTVPIDLSDREHFLAQRDTAADDLFIGKPVLGRVSHRQTIQITRKMLAPDGSFDGVIVLSLDPEYLSRLFGSVDLGKTGVVTIAGTDGVVRAVARASMGAGTVVIGQSMAGTPLMLEVARASSGTFAAVSASDGVRRIFSFRQLQDYPLIVNVGVGEAEVLAVYATNRVSYLVLASLLTALLLAVGLAVLARQSRLRRAGEALRASEAAYARKSDLLRTTLEHMSQGILLIDADGRIPVCNRWAIDKLGLPDALMEDIPAVGDVARWRSRHDAPATAAGCDEALSRLFEPAGDPSEEPRTYEQAWPNGTILEIRGTPTPGGGVVRTFTDITQRRQREAELRAARDEADRAARVKADFLANMSHEIRSPMSGMLGVLELLRRTALDEEQARMAGMIQNSASGLLAVLNEILDFSKIEAAAVTIDRETVRPRALVTEVVQPHAHAAGLKGVTLTARFGAGVPDHIETDPLRLRQILNNLLSNAVKFTASGAIDLVADVVLDGPEPMLRVAVRDGGIGMDAGVVGRLFEPFMQADGSTTRTFGGTGLGLSISRRLARLLGGDLTATSQSGVGSEFTLLLPLIVVPEPDGGGAAGGDPFVPNGLGAGIRVLVADDDPTNRWVATRMLEMLGLAADTVEDGETALLALRSGAYDLLITDCHMPRMDGVALTRAVREAPEAGLRDLLIVGLTADVTAEQRERCRQAGMTDVDIKPLTLERLSILVSRLLPRAAMLASDTPRPAAPAARAVDAGQYPAFDDRTWHELYVPGDREGEAWLRQYQDVAARMSDELAALLHVTDDAAIPRDAIAATAHRLAGASYTAGAIAAGEAARALEAASARAGLDGLLALHSAVRAELAAAAEAMARFLSDVQSELIA